MWDELKNAIDGTGLSVAKVGQSSGVAPATLYAWVNEMPAPFKKLLSISEATSASPNALLGYKVDKGDASPEDKPGQTTIRSTSIELTSSEWELVRQTLGKSLASLRERFASGRIEMSDAEEANALWDVLAKIEGAI